MHNLNLKRKTIRCFFDSSLSVIGASVELSCFLLFFEWRRLLLVYLRLLFDIVMSGCWLLVAGTRQFAPHFHLNRAETERKRSSSSSNANEIGIRLATSASSTSIEYSEQLTYTKKTRTFIAIRFECWRSIYLSLHVFSRSAPAIQDDTYRERCEKWNQAEKSRQHRATSLSLQLKWG